MFSFNGLRKQALSTIVSLPRKTTWDFFKRYLFVVSLTYKKPLDVVDTHLAEHKKFLDAQYEAKHFVTSGRKIPRTGGVIIASVSTRNELNKILEQDPFKKLGIASYEVHEFLPTMSRADFSVIAAEDQRIQKPTNSK